MQIWLLKALKDSAGADGDGVVQVLKQPSLIDDPRMDRLKLAVRFTHKLMLTYHAVIVGAVLLYALVHWIEKLCYAKRRENLHDKSQKCDEDTALLVESQSVQLRIIRRPQRAGILLARLRGFLMYQPATIPVVGKQLPPNQTSLVLLGLIAVNVFYLLFNCPTDIYGSIFVFGDRAGALFAANLPLLYLLAAKNQPLKSLTGLSYESLNIVHRRLGEWLCLLGLIHGASMFGVWYRIIRPLARWSLAFYLTQKIVILGLGTLASYELLFLPSLRYVRERRYEFFLVSHVVPQFAALVFLFLHHPQSRVYVAIVFAIYVIDRIIFRAGFKLYTTEATLAILDDNDSVMIEAEWPHDQTQPCVFSRSIKGGWQAAAHVFITMPELSRWHKLQAHPFSIMSLPPTSSDTTATLQLLVRAQSGFSRTLLDYARNHPKESVQVWLDGPYGSPTAFETLSRADTAIVLAGGSGISVAYPLVSALISHQQRLAYRRSTLETQMRDTRRRPTLPRRICLLWTFRYDTQKSWLAPEYLQALNDAGVEVIMPPATSTHGRLALDKQLHDLLRLRNGYSDGQIFDNGKVAVLCSGPDEMSRRVRNHCADLVSKHLQDIDFVVEKFGW